MHIRVLGELCPRRIEVEISGEGLLEITLQINFFHYYISRPHVNSRNLSH